jgi:hypothetical protein
MTFALIVRGLVWVSAPTPWCMFALLTATKATILDILKLRLNGTDIKEER